MQTASAAYADIADRHKTAAGWDWKTTSALLAVRGRARVTWLEGGYSLAGLVFKQKVSGRQRSQLLITQPSGGQTGTGSAPAEGGWYWAMLAVATTAPRSIVPSNKRSDFFIIVFLNNG